MRQGRGCRGGWRGARGDEGRGTHLTFGLTKLVFPRSTGNFLKWGYVEMSRTTNLMFYYSFFSYEDAGDRQIRIEQDEKINKSIVEFGER